MKKFADFPVCNCTGEYGCEECNPSPKLEDLTCFDCPSRNDCKYVDDFYNTNGDCLAEK